MSFLAVDAGNTNISGAVWEGGGWRGHWRLGTLPHRTSDEYAVALGFLLSAQGIDLREISRVGLGSVVPGVTPELVRFVREWIGVDPQIAGQDLNWGLALDMASPAEVGADRRLNALAAWKLFGDRGQPLIVVDFGTATTFDVINSAGVYCGGAIAPGIGVSLDGLHHAAARLPRVSFARPQAALGRDTVGAMLSGAYWGYTGLVKEIISRLSQELAADPYVIGTGGLAAALRGEENLFDRVEEDLTLNGLRFFAEEKEKQIAGIASGQNY